MSQVFAFSQLNALDAQWPLTKHNVQAILEEAASGAVPHASLTPHLAQIVMGCLKTHANCKPMQPTPRSAHGVDMVLAPKMELAFNAQTLTKSFTEFLSTTPRQFSMLKHPSRTNALALSRDAHFAEAEWD
jgi:hypothetical protein